MGAQSFRIFRPTYTDRATRKTRTSRHFHISFKDHLRRRQRIIGETSEKSTYSLWLRIRDLIELRRDGGAPDAKLSKWVDALDDVTRRKLIDMDLIDAHAMNAGAALVAMLDSDNAARPGFKQSILAGGSTAEHAVDEARRVRRILEGCELLTWRDLNRPGASKAVAVYLAGLRAKDIIGGQSVVKHVRSIRHFCRWLVDAGRAPSVALAGLAPPKNAEVEKRERRPLSADEVRKLIEIAAAGDELLGLSGDERAILYRVAFETGLRPGALRSLKVSQFDLDSDPPTVTTAAVYNKRRRTHAQVLRPALAAELRERFASKTTTATALRMPSEWELAKMLRHDLAKARSAWLAEAKGAKVRQQRERSEFLADKPASGELVDFYSLRHGHGTALAEAGVPLHAIAASLHHVTTRTSERYLHATRKSIAAAVAALPDLVPARDTQGTTRKRSIG